jgi:HNH endonuclease
MPITDRTRKILWIKAGGRCSICNEQLATDATDEDDPSVFGEECHIVARSPGGPRAADIADIDSYDNLILLCRKHHKQVDDQRSYFTVERLKTIKQEHEKREANRSGPVRLIPDPTKPTPKLFKLCITGEDLWAAFDGTASFNSRWPAGLTDEQGDAVDALLDELRDWMDIADELSFREKRRVGKDLGEHVLRLASVGLLVGTRERYLLLTGGVSGYSSSWRTIDIAFFPVNEARAGDGKLLFDPSRIPQSEGSHGPTEDERTT